MLASRVLIAASLAAGITAGCATSGEESDYAPYAEPYAFVEPGVASTTRKEAPAFIHTVDGQQPVSSRYSIPVAPGKHMLEVYFSSGSVAGSPEKHRKSIELQAAPCTRYRVVARYVSLVNPGEWEPVVYSEVIGECAKKFSTKQTP